MAGRLTPLGFILKWIVVPVSLGAIGYFLVGPRVELPKELKSKVQEVTGQGSKPNTLQAANEGDNEGDPDKPEKTFAAPEVDVTVTALNRPTKPKRKKRRRKPPVTTPSQSEPSAPEPPADGGGGGGGEPPPTGDGV